MPVTGMRPEERLVLDMDKEILSLRDHIANGSCENWEEYRFQTGRLNGLVDARRRFGEALAAEGDEE